MSITNVRVLLSALREYAVLQCTAALVRDPNSPADWIVIGPSASHKARHEQVVVLCKGSGSGQLKERDPAPDLIEVDHQADLFFRHGGSHFRERNPLNASAAEFDAMRTGNRFALPDLRPCPSAELATDPLF